jgi:hypothetical protein
MHSGAPYRRKERQGCVAVTARCCCLAWSPRPRHVLAVEAIHEAAVSLRRCAGWDTDLGHFQFELAKGPKRKVVDPSLLSQLLLRAISQ